MKLDLIIPYLLNPPSVSDVPGCRRLETVLSRSRVLPAKQGYSAQLFALAGLPETTSVARLSARLDGCDADAQLWRADPVCIQAQSDHALLLGSASLDIEENEASQLVDAFNRHFAADGLSLKMGQAHRWYLSSSDPLDVETTALDQATGRNVRLFLPQGPHALRWRKILNETQMLFHTHAVNQQRENRGQRVINGVWLWGEGDVIASRQQKNEVVFSNDALARSVAHCLSMPVKSVQDWLQQPTGGWLVLDELIQPACHADQDAWLQAFESLCASLLPAIFSALKSGVLQQIDLYTADGRVFELHRSDMYKFWRRRKPLTHWLVHEN